MKTSKKPIAAVLTDTHLKPSNIEVNIKVFLEAFGIIQSLGLNILQHGGDIFESRKGQTQEVLLAWKYILDRAKEAGIKIVAIPGNHDKTDYASHDSFLDPFSNHPAFVLFKECAGLWIEEHPKFWIHYMPFFSDDKYLEEFKPILATKGQKNILLTHIGMDGARMNNGTIVQSKITKELFKDFDKVMIGHYHDSNNDMYIGSSIQHTFGETPDKGLTVLYDDLSHETIPLDFPKFLSFKVDVKDMTMKDIEDFKKEKEKTGNQYCVVLTGDTAKIKAYDKHYLQEAGISVKTEEEKIIEEEVEQRITPFTDTSILEVFKVFCDKNELTYETGIKYIQKALTK